MRSFTAWGLAALLALPALPVTAAAPADEGVSAAAAASTPDDGASQADAAEDSQAEEQDQEARLTAVEGPVYVHLADRAEEEYAAAEADMPISSGDEIRVGTAGSAELTLDGHTVIQLGANSDFVVNSLAPSRTEFHLGLGSLVAKIKHLVEGRRMEFHTDGAVAAVRGTELGVAQEEGQPARVGVFDEGDVSVTGSRGEGEVRLGPHQETAVAPGKPVTGAAPMSWWSSRQDRMERARARQRRFLRSWKPRSLGQRRAWRRRLLQRPALKRDGLRGLSPRQRQRGYGALRERQQELRRELRERRQDLKGRRGERGQRRQRFQQERQRRDERRMQKAQRGRRSEAFPPRPDPGAQPRGERRRERRFARGGRGR